VQTTIHTDVVVDSHTRTNGDNIPNKAHIVASILDFITKIQDGDSGIKDAATIIGQKDEVVAGARNTTPTAALPPTTTGAIPATGSVFYVPGDSDTAFVPDWFDREHWERWNRSDGIVGTLVDDPIVHLWNESHNKIILEMEILENVLRGWTIEVDKHMFGGVNVP
jgi:hypothetical protein